ncbi:MAG: DAK2 domain-containing protein [Oscillospiraceae bacterium]|nr:DAK2 domain-containing protein [Oscillospiraceae bacterium]
MITGKILRDSIISGANLIISKKSSVDELNVFPVPDGDTGTNMSMTIGAAKRDLANLPDDCTVEKVASVTASSMLRGARGNSGVISSLLFRGFAKALTGKTEASAQDLAAALRSGVDAAYKAVMKPTEGTMLTVARVACEKAETMKEETDEVVLWSAVVDAAQEALDYTPEQLPVLKKAGVVDAGGQGVVYIFTGMLQFLRDGVMVEGEAVTEKTTAQTFKPKGIYSKDLADSDYGEDDHGYCTEFIVYKNKVASAERLRAYLEAIGNSVVVVEDDEIIKCHVHTEDPGRALSEAVRHGAMTNLKIENMDMQVEAIEEKGKGLEKEQADADSEAKFKYTAVDADMPFGFVAVAAGEGLESIFTDLGVNAVVTGGQTMNPSTDDILQAVHSVGAKTVFVMPNNKNIIMAAEQAASLADREVVVLPTRTIPQGITAMLNFDPEMDAKQNTINMNIAAQNVQTGSVTFAARNSDFDGHKIKEGEILALENGKLAFTEKSIEKAAIKLAKNMVKKDTSFITVIYGEGISETEAEIVCEGIRAKVGKNIEVSAIKGDQPVYYYFISVE